MKPASAADLESGTCCSAEARRQARPDPIPRALRLEYLTIAWNVVEGLVGVAAAMLAGSVAILGFAMDSFVECASAAVMVWRLHAGRGQPACSPRLDAMERRARRLVGGSLFLLAAYVAADALATLCAGDRPSFSPLGTALLILSAGVMLRLARAKRQVARALRSGAMEADAFQSTACWWLSLSALAGVGLNGLLGWWWADPLAAIAIAGLIAREGREAWQGRKCSC